MKFKMIAIISLALLFGCTSQQPIELVHDGQARATIVVPADTPRWTNTAAHWLQDYVKQSTGATLPIVVEGSLEVPGAIISVGHTVLAREAKIAVNDLKWDGCRQVVRGNTLFLIGKDQTKFFKRQNGKWNNNGPHGTARAALKFLEDVCHVRWFMPGPNGVNVPKHRSLIVDADYDKTFIPPFGFSDGRFPYESGFLPGDATTPGSLANNFRVAVAANVGGHTYTWLVPAEKYFDQHPEYFELINGKRTAAGNHLCTSNPEVRQLILEGIREKFDLGYDIVSLGQADGYIRCECDNCEAMDNYRWSPSQRSWNDFMYDDQGLRETPCGRLLLAHKWVIDRLRESHPDKKVLIMSYGPTTWPSKKIDYFGDNALVELSIQEPAVVNAWKGKTAGITGYVYWYDTQLPMGLDVHATPHEVSDRLRWLHAQGFIGMYHFPETAWGFNGPVFWVMGRMMGDPSLDYRELVKEYCDGVFGRAGGSMLAFYEALYKDREKLLTLDERRPSRHPKGMTTGDIYLMHYTPERLAALEKHLTAAKAAADTDRACGWLRLVSEEFEYAKGITLMVRDYRAYKKEPTDKAWQLVKQRVDHFNELRWKIINYDDDYVTNWFPGHPIYANHLTGGLQHENKVYYTPWKTRKAAVLEKGLKGLGLGYGASFGYNFIREPLTLNFNTIRP